MVLLVDIGNSNIVFGITNDNDNIEKTFRLKSFTDKTSDEYFILFNNIVSVKEIEGVGSTFNPEYHEAVSLVQDETLGEKEIKEVFRKGYKIGEKVIRHSMVVVAN